MNRDTYNPRQSILWTLLQSVDSDEVSLQDWMFGGSLDTVMTTAPNHPLSQERLADLEQLDWDAWTDEEWLNEAAALGELEHYRNDHPNPAAGHFDSHTAKETLSRSSGYEPLELGATSVEYSRSFALLKQRLKISAEDNPPLFPWESEVREYDEVFATEAISATATGLIGTWQSLWHQISLPVTLPAEVMAHITRQCQDLVQSSVKDGMRLIHAIESLFPEHNPQQMHDLAGLVLQGGVRKTGESLASRFLGLNVPATYQGASENQQVALAMVAAYELMNLLTLKLSSREPEVSQTWGLPTGTVALRATYHTSLQVVRLEITLPEPGTLSVVGVDHSLSVRREEAGAAVLLLPDVQLGANYDLQLLLDGCADPLKLSIHVDR